MSATKIELDSGLLMKALGGLLEHPLEVPREVLERLLDLFGVPGELCRIESNTAGGTVKVVLHPSKSLLELAATLRALDV